MKAKSNRPNGRGHKYYVQSIKNEKDIVVKQILHSDYSIKPRRK